MDQEPSRNAHPEIMTPKEVAEYLKLPLSTVYKLTQEGKLPGTKFGKHWRYLRSDIESYLTGLNAMQSFGAAYERRRFPRKICDLHATFAVNVPNLKTCKGIGTIRNMSAGGARLEIESLSIEGQLILRGDPIVVEVRARDYDGSFATKKLHGVVVRFEQGTHTSVWIQFDEVSYRDANEVVIRLAS